MLPAAPAFSTLAARIDEIAKELGGEGLAVSMYDYETGLQWSHRGDRWFHSASTIKVAVLVALFGAIDSGRFSLDSRLHVRNRFMSLLDGTPFRVSAGRDADKAVYAAIGKTMRVGDLLRLPSFAAGIFRASRDSARCRTRRGKAGWLASTVTSRIPSPETRTSSVRWPGSRCGSFARC